MAPNRDTRQALNAARRETLRRYEAMKTHRRQMEVFDRARSRAENVSSAAWRIACSPHRGWIGLR